MSLPTTRADWLLFQSQQHFQKLAQLAIKTEGAQRMGKVAAQQHTVSNSFSEVGGIPKEALAVAGTGKKVVGAIKRLVSGGTKSPTVKLPGPKGGAPSVGGSPGGAPRASAPAVQQPKPAAGNSFAQIPDKQFATNFRPSRPTGRVKPQAKSPFAQIPQERFAPGFQSSGPRAATGRVSGPPASAQRPVSVAPAAQGGAAAPPPAVSTPTRALGGAGTPAAPPPIPPAAAPPQSLPGGIEGIRAPGGTPKVPPPPATPQTPPGGTPKSAPAQNYELSDAIDPNINPLAKGKAELAGPELKPASTGDAVKEVGTTAAESAADKVVEKGKGWWGGLPSSVQWLPTAGLVGGGLALGGAGLGVGQAVGGITSRTGGGNYRYGAGTPYPGQVSYQM